MRQYITPNLGHIGIRELRPDQIQDFYSLMHENVIGVLKIRKIHAVLSNALSHAVKLNLIGANPASAAIKPQKPAKEMAIFDERQISQMLVAARGTRLEAILYLPVMTGMRQMEILGLKWSDLDWIKQTLTVGRQLVRPEEGKAQSSSPKTKYGRRTISLGSNAIEVLRSHYERQHLERQAAGDDWTEDDLIFTTSIGKPLHPTNLLRDFKKLLRGAGLPVIRFHDLRHTAASLMLTHGIPVLVVSRVLGHSRPSITLDVYGHLMPSMQAEAAEKMDALLSPIEITGSSRLQPVAADNSPISQVANHTPISSRN